eukprot:183225_1
MRSRCDFSYFSGYYCKQRNRDEKDFAQAEKRLQSADVQLIPIPVVREDGEGDHDDETDEELYEEFKDNKDQQATAGGAMTSDDYGLIRKILISSNVDDWE